MKNSIKTSDSFKDWMIIHIQDNDLLNFIGQNNIGGFTTLISPEEYNFMDRGLRVAGYGVNFFKTSEFSYLDDDCFIKKINEGDYNILLLSNCDLASGDSGGPMYDEDGGQFQLLAINIGAGDQGFYREINYSHAYASYSVSLVELKRALKKYNETLLLEILSKQFFQIKKK